MADRYDSSGPSIRQRVEAVKAKLAIDSVIAREVKLSGSSSSKTRRGRCPFHGSNSASFAVLPRGGKAGSMLHAFAHCHGCQWHGDVIGFVRDMYGKDFLAALEWCEAEAGISPADAAALAANPVQRKKNPSPRPGRDLLEPVDQARWIWKHAHRDDTAVRRYLLARGIPARVLTAERLASFRFMGDCPCSAWVAGTDPREGGKVPVAPAVIALVVKPGFLLAPSSAGRDASASLGSSGDPTPDGATPPVGQSASGSPAASGERDQLQWQALGIHVTYLAPDGEGPMVRRKPWARPDDPDPMLPKRRMLGPVGGGAVILGKYTPDAPLFVGEGNETVLSAMALANAPGHAVGVATLSLDNLQGGPLLWAGREGERCWPLHAIEPDPERPCFTIPGHRGPVMGLIDSDMSPLRGRRDRQTGEFLGELVVAGKGARWERRAISGAERARICAELFVQGWRRTGAGPVTAMRAPVGQDFNDAVREMAS